MYNQLLVHEMVNAVNREREMTGAAHGRNEMRFDMSGLNGLTAARDKVGGALVRVGRRLNGSAAPRPEPVGR